MFSSSIAALLLVVASAVASPIGSAPKCNAATAKLQLPANQTALVAPSTPPSMVLLGVGVQNYTCTNGAYVSAGAVADLFDISCFAQSPQFSTIQNTAFSIWSAAPPSLSASRLSILAASWPEPIKLMVEHYFVTNPNGAGLSPVWDARSTGIAKGDSNAFVLASKTGTIPAPTGANDVAWLQLTNVQGDLATTIFRTDTKGGQPPASCTAGSPMLSVKYTSKYWLFGSTAKLTLS